MFLPVDSAALAGEHAELAGGLTNRQYAEICEILGTSCPMEFAAQATNCTSPDSGNMEVLARYGTPAQRAKWLVPLLQGGCLGSGLNLDRRPICSLRCFPLCFWQDMHTMWASVEDRRDCALIGACPPHPVHPVDPTVATEQPPQARSGHASRCGSGMRLPPPKKIPILADSKKTPHKQQHTSTPFCRCCQCSAVLDLTGRMMCPFSAVAHRTPQHADPLPVSNNGGNGAVFRTEPAVASSDATNIGIEIKRDERTGEYVVNGRKWWITGAGSLHCKIMILMGKTNPGNPLHSQQSQM